MKRRAGLGPLILAMIVTAIGMILGVSHFGAARALRRTGYQQADYLKARYLAQAGLQKALVVLKREHQAGYYGWSYPEQRHGKYVPYQEFAGDLNDGQFEVLRVEPVVLDAAERSPRPLANREYRLHGRPAGNYDVFRVEALGTSPGGRQRVKVSAMVKLVRLVIRPSAMEEL